MHIIVFLPWNKPVTFGKTYGKSQDNEDNSSREELGNLDTRFTKLIEGFGCLYKRISHVTGKLLCCCSLISQVLYERAGVCPAIAL